MASTIIIGGGAIGLGLAWHLGKRGAGDVLLLERNRLTSGTSWHAAGIVGPLRATPNMTRLAMYAGQAFPELGRAQALIEETLTCFRERRGGRMLAEIDRLTGFRPGPCAPDAAVHVGALVEVEDADTGEGRTFFLAPSGAGVTLSGPGGDGFLSVVTQQSPVGRAVIGRRAGDVVDVTVEGEIREWTITWVG